MKKNGADVYSQNKNTSKLMNDSTKLDSDSAHNKTSLYSSGINKGNKRTRVGSAVTTKHS